MPWTVTLASRRGVSDGVNSRDRDGAECCGEKPWWAASPRAKPPIWEGKSRELGLDRGWMGAGGDDGLLMLACFCRFLCLMHVQTRHWGAIDR